jgi:hypothetical protein
MACRLSANLHRLLLVAVEDLPHPSLCAFGRSRSLSVSFMSSALWLAVCAILLFRLPSLDSPPTMSRPSEGLCRLLRYSWEFPLHELPSCVPGHTDSLTIFLGCRPETFGSAKAAIFLLSLILIFL